MALMYLSVMGLALIVAQQNPVAEPVPEETIHEYGQWAVDQIERSNKEMDKEIHKTVNALGSGVETAITSLAEVADRMMYDPPTVPILRSPDPRDRYFGSGIAKEQLTIYGSRDGWPLPMEIEEEAEVSDTTKLWEKSLAELDRSIDEFDRGMKRGDNLFERLEQLEKQIEVNIGAAQPTGSATPPEPP